jgi:hypothetical protein
MQFRHRGHAKQETLSGSDNAQACRSSACTQSPEPPPLRDSPVLLAYDFAFGRALICFLVMLVIRNFAIWVEFQRTRLHRDILVTHAQKPTNIHRKRGRLARFAVIGIKT